MSPLLSFPFHAGIAELYVLPLAVIGPVRPFLTTAITLSGEPVTIGLPASGGNTPGVPLPLTLWQLEQFAL
jgi:hypothetical protein